MAILSKSMKSTDPLILAGIGIFCVLTSWLVAVAPFELSIGIALGIVSFLVVLVNLKLGLFLLIYSMLLSPEIDITGGGGAGGQEAKKAVSIRLDDLLLLLICFVWLVKGAVFRNIAIIQRTPINKYIVAYIIVVLLSTIFGMIDGKVQLKSGFFFTMKYVEYYFIFFMTMNVIKTAGEEKYPNRLIKAMFITALIVAIYAIVQMGTKSRVSAPFEGEIGEPNTLGMYLLIIGSLVYGQIYHGINIVQRHRHWGFLLILSIPFLATLSRASYLALLPIVFMFMFFSKYRIWLIFVMSFAVLVVPFTLPQIKEELKSAFSSEIKKMSRKATSNIGSSGGARVEKFFDDLFNQSFDRILFTFTQKQKKWRRQQRLLGVKVDSSTTARLESWQNVGTDFVDRPLFGTGTTGYGFVDGQYIKVLIESGVLGLATFLTLMFQIFRKSLSIYKRAQTPFYKGIAMGFLCSFAGMLTHALASNTFIIIRIMEPFCLVMGIVFMIPYIEGLNKEQSTIEEQVPDSDLTIR